MKPGDRFVFAEGVRWPCNTVEEILAAKAALSLFLESNSETRELPVYEVRSIDGDEVPCEVSETPGRLYVTANGREVIP